VVRCKKSSIFSSKDECFQGWSEYFSAKFFFDESDCLFNFNSGWKTLRFAIDLFFSWYQVFWA
jgi:hypothetical protein